MEAEGPSPTGQQRDTFVSPKPRDSDTSLPIPILFDKF